MKDNGTDTRNHEWPAKTYNMKVSDQRQGKRIGLEREPLSDVELNQIANGGRELMSGTDPGANPGQSFSGRGHAALIRRRGHRGNFIPPGPRER